MTTDAEVCPHCGEPVVGDSFYCGSCGKPVAPSERPMPNRKQTMLGVMPEGLIKQAEAAISVRVSDPGMPPGGSADPGDAREPERTTDVGISEPPVGQIGRTMLGMPQAPAAGAPASAEASSGKNAFGGRTMLGMPLNAAAHAPAASADAPASEKGAASFAGGRTLLGVAVAPEMLKPNAANSKAEPGASLETTGSKKLEPARTAYGLEQGAPEVESVPRGSRPSGAQAPTTAARGSRPSGSIRRGPAPAVIGFASVALLGAVALTFLALRGHGPDVHVRVVTDADGESMLFEVPGATDGAKLRFGGQEKALSAGRASFPLAPDSLRVGKNAVLFDIVRPGGEIESGRVGLSVDYRVTLDTAPLRAGKAEVDVVVAALPGSKVWLDGTEVKLDPQGRAVRTDALEPATASGRAEHTVKYRVQPPSGEASVGEVHASIPVTMMQIDRPGALVVTDRDKIEIAGAVDKDARVTIDGQAVDVRSGRFLYNYPLAHTGEFWPQVVAIAGGKAPHAATLSVQRVDDLAKAAQGFEPDRSLTYAKIAQNPNIYRGQRVEFEGRVYNVNVEGGRSALQVLVRTCSRGERCPLWVSYPAATEFTVDSWVRVLGIMQGEQQFRSETEQVKSVPKVEAVFLLPAKP